MPQKTIIEGSNGYAADVVQANGHRGLVVSTIPGLVWQANSKFFSNPVNGLNMNIDESASGTPDGINNGTDTVLWTASALTGTWDFASTTVAQAGTKSIDATATVNGDQALFTRSSAIDSGSYSSLSGYIYLTKFNPLGNQVLLSFRLAGANVGVVINIADFVDTGNLNVWLKFTIPLSTLELIGNVDEMVIQTVRSTGAQPDYYLDTVQLEESGSAIYTAEPEKGERYEFDTIELFMVDALGTTLTDNSMLNLSYDKFLGVTQLTNGIVLRLTRKGEITFNATFRDLGDILFAAFTIDAVGSDGTNTFLKLQAKLSDYARLEYDTRDKIEMIISDDLSGLLRFRANIRGRSLEN
jgi:hypothetical protein